MDLAQEGGRHPKQAATCLARFCPCGVFNAVRAKLVLRRRGWGSRRPFGVNDELNMGCRLSLTHGRVR